MAGRRERMAEVPRLRGRLREMDRVRRDAVVGHRHDLRRHLRRAVVEALQTAETPPGAVGVGRAGQGRVVRAEKRPAAAAVDPELVKRPGQVEALLRVADHQDDRHLGVVQHELGNLGGELDGLVVGQLREVGPLRLGAQNRPVHAVVADVLRTQEVLQPALRRLRVLAVPELHLQVQHRALRATLLDQRHLSDQRIETVGSVVHPRRLDERLRRQPGQVRRLPLHQDAPVRDRAQDPPELARFGGDPVVTHAVQRSLADLDDVHPVLQTALAVALEARALCLELCRHAVEDGGGLLQIDVADRRGDETAHVARRVRLEIVPERCQPVRTRLGRQAWMPSEPSLVRPLVHLGS